MQDIREKAQKHAVQRQLNAATYESDRQRAVQERRTELEAYTGQNVQKIPAFSSENQEDRLLRVAAYCRVSTDDIDQVFSIELQKNEYRKKIKSNPKWKYVGTYVDMYNRILIQYPPHGSVEKWLKQRLSADLSRLPKAFFFVS